ncbi:MAG: hypothetical protein AAF664_21160, partial [Planctomycetota bacterium]
GCLPPSFFPCGVVGVPARLFSLLFFVGALPPPLLRTNKPNTWKLDMLNTDTRQVDPEIGRPLASLEIGHRVADFRQVLETNGFEMNRPSVV